MQHSARPSRRRVAFTAVVLAAAGLPALAVAPTPASADELVNESFAGATTRLGEWEAPSPKGTHTPCLTAAPVSAPGSLRACNAVRDGARPDPVGKGVFQLTDNSRQDAGGLVLNRPLKAGKGLQVDFDVYMYNASTPRAADGISFYLLDGAQEPSTGEPGGSLGYTGVKGAIVGIGLDQYGNFVTRGAGASDTTAPIPNAIGVRGAESTGYKLLKSVRLDPASQRLDAPDARTREAARRHVTVKLSAANFLSLSMDFGRGPQEIIKDLDLDNLPGQPKLPPTLKLGFAASTGGHTSYHELSGFTARELTPSLSVRATGNATVRAGGTATTSLEVANAAAAGPTSGAVTTTYRLPAGFTPRTARGDGWDCQISGDTVTCARDALLGPGDTAPPIAVTYDVDGSAAGPVTSTATVTTPGDPEAGGTLTRFEQRVEVAPSALDVAVTRDGEVRPGGTTYHVAVSNAASAGPSAGPLTAVFTAPVGATVRSATGPGWDCRTAGQTVTCARPGPLTPGATAPPVDIVLDYPDTVDGLPVRVTAKVTAPGDAHPAGATATDTAVGVAAATRGPALSLDLSRRSSPVAGRTTTYHLLAVNAATAGPTDGPVTVTLTAPAGVTPERASGQGWDCRIEGRRVTCTRTDVLRPGDGYPRIDVDLAFAAETAGRGLALTAETGGVRVTDALVVRRPPQPPGVVDLTTSVLEIG